MSLVRFLLVLAVGTILAWAGWVTVIFSLDPLNGGFVGRMMFFVSLGLALIGTLTIGGFFVRYWWEKDPLPFRQIGFALRQATIISLTAVVALILQSGRMLSWWLGLILIMFAIVVEMFFLAGQSRHPHLRS